MYNFERLYLSCFLKFYRYKITMLLAFFVSVYKGIIQDLVTNYLSLTLFQEEQLSVTGKGFALSTGKLSTRLDQGQCAGTGIRMSPIGLHMC